MTKNAQIQLLDSRDFESSVSESEFGDLLNSLNQLLEENGKQAMETGRSRNDSIIVLFLFG